MIISYIRENIREKSKIPVPKIRLHSQKMETELTVVIRVYDDGVAYRYESKEGASVSQEKRVSLYCPDQAALLSYRNSQITPMRELTKNIP